MISRKQTEKVGIVYAGKNYQVRNLLTLQNVFQQIITF